MHTSAPSSIEATAHRAAAAGSSGRNPSATATSARVGVVPGYASPTASRPSTRLTFVSRTTARCPYAKLATADAV